MKVSLSWLKDYVSIEMKPEDLADALTMTGLEVEVISDRYDYLDSVVVGRIVKISPHPNADKLRLCDVDMGDRMMRVVCGAPNAAEGQLAPLALTGTEFPDGSVLEKSVIRGEASEGMLCSESELELGTDTSGIMILDPGCRVGDKLVTALNLSDKVFDIDLTPNRSDCLSIIGIAREVAAIQKTTMKYPHTDISDSGNDITRLTSVTIKDPDHCPRYSARLIEDIKIGPSPFWLQDRLLSVGLRPINNIVDITNFVMMEMGQPLHGFDFDQLADQRIVVRTADEGEMFTTLDGKERKLSPNALMICDGEKPVGIAGVMGGLNSEIEGTTTRVLLESAYFSPMSIRKTAKKMGLNTEASHRFERGTDPEGTVKALNRAAQLMAELGNGRLVNGLIDEHSGPASAKNISLSIKDTNRLLGISLGQNEMADALRSIEFGVEKEGEDRLTVIPPSFRVDIARPVDLMEEIARLSGYQNIPTTFPAIPAQARESERKLELRQRIKRILIGFGFTEAVNYSFMNRLACDQLRLGQDDPKRSLLDILNPLTEDQGVMRTSLVPGLLETMRRNISQQVKDLKLFEIGKTFISKGQDTLPEEIEFISGLWTGTLSDALWHAKETECDFYDIKGVVEGLLNGLNVKDASFTRVPDDSCRYTKVGHTAQLAVGGEILGLVGKTHPEVLRDFDLKQNAFIFELNLDRLVPFIPRTKQAKPIPRYPSTSRDVTMIVNKDTEAGSILEGVRKINEALVEDLYLFGVYEGNPVPEGNKSVSFRITYRSSEETLEDDVINNIHKNISDILIKEFDATLP
ncbi:phenylalanine--tRNA ligase subunit beta [Desulfonema magnum]|uniref:Phenylalanine--tRNA ligase beta subunit n=1 Tax=Desulfonema magnum TaxID=45655 RepID=A0A975BUW5_9BACT|nr:phenylalanine--tRNA ligase subunit beta [Desulfonema magnum]QTA91585.1 Phenylalanine--tRNA ligase beta subunit [Desulfonema magnum]